MCTLQRLDVDWQNWFSLHYLWSKYVLHSLTSPQFAQTSLWLSCYMSLGSRTLNKTMMTMTLSWSSCGWIGVSWASPPPPVSTKDTTSYHRKSEWQDLDIYLPQAQSWGLGWECHPPLLVQPHLSTHLGIPILSRSATFSASHSLPLLTISCRHT